MVVQLSFIYGAQAAYYARGKKGREIPVQKLGKMGSLNPVTQNLRKPCTHVEGSVYAKENENGLPSL
jgi:hypothetical protein